MRRRIPAALLAGCAAIAINTLALKAADVVPLATAHGGLLRLLQGWLAQPLDRAGANAWWTALGGPALPSGAVRFLGRTGLSSPLAVEELAVGAVAAQLLAARELARQPLAVELDAVGVGFSFRSERYARQGDRSVGAGFAPLSRFWRTADGWIRLHGNYPHHRAAIERVLGPGSPAEVIGRWPAEELETAVVEEGGAAADGDAP